MDTIKTEVIFRKYKDGDIIALFPYIVGNRYLLCMSYMFIGQHALATLDLIKTTKLATPEEYKELFDELTNQIGYNLLIKKKVNWKKHKFEYHKKLSQ